MIMPPAAKGNYLAGDPVSREALDAIMPGLDHDVRIEVASVTVREEDDIHGEGEPEDEAAADAVDRADEEARRRPARSAPLAQNKEPT